MAAASDPYIHTVTIMSGTQISKSETLLNIAGYYIHLDPSPILLVQPTQEAAAIFSKERFTPMVEATPVLRDLVYDSKYRDSQNTIGHKDFTGGSLDFVGANSPTDLASRPKRIILADEVDKYPPSAGTEGDPLALAEERASTYHAVGRAKFIRTCSPTVKGASRIGREWEASDKRELFLTCPHCQTAQVLGWSHVRWDRNEAGAHLPDTAAIACEFCGTVWSEQERLRALDALGTAPGYGYRQTKPFSCCSEQQDPEKWDDAGRAVCKTCNKRAPFSGHAGFRCSKLYSRRHRLSDIVREFLDAQIDPALLQKFTNTALAELWDPAIGEGLDGTGLIARAENYGPESLPEDVRVITGFCDVQGNRLEVQLIGWGADEEAWPFLYEIIHQDPAQPQAWNELEALLRRQFETVEGRHLRIAAFGIDTGGHHQAQVTSFCKQRKGRRIFPTKGIAGQREMWAGRAKRTKQNEVIWLIGVDAGKDALYSRLKIRVPENPGQRRPGFIHFPVGENFGPEYFDQLTSERREIRRRLGQPYLCWSLPEGKRNEALDTWVGALAVRRSLPRHIDRTLSFKIDPEARNRPAEVTVELLPEAPTMIRSPAPPPPPLPQVGPRVIIEQRSQRRRFTSLLAR